jgi:nitrogen fixation protein NifB
MKDETWGNIGSKFAHLISAHPCYNEKAHFTVARIHLPVAPKCNIQCNYCTRKIDKCEHRPGVASGIMTPEEVLKKVEDTMKSMGNLKVVGVAGPGEALFNEETFKALGLIHERYPDLLKCIASNGLLLPEKLEDVMRVGVTSLTVTINAVDPEVAAKIYSWVYYEGKTYRGVEGAELLIKQQFKGVKMAAKRGLVVKVNTVLVPNINFEQIREIAKRAAKSGAMLMNIIPMIPLYKFEKETAPTCDDLNVARTIAEEYLPQFRLCRQCRADAVGVPGEEPCGSPAQSAEYYHG